ncbi:MAG: DNA translocase FtsK [Acidobacteria bacterium]|nr:DNA translocase FtsK [Acidobacteriota bacterium]MBI3661628.1 DNA translocase FtsK [Acidobacteriota bacterium]
MRILTPTENHRLNELVGFLGVTLAVLMALSLLSYNPHDSALNVSAPLPVEGMRPARNWIGPFGAHGADFLFQLLGYAAFLLPVTIFVVGMRWFRSQAVTSPIVKLSGMALLIASLSALLTLVGLPEVRSTLPAGGVLGVLLSKALLAGFNPVGAHVLAVSFFLTALFLTTRFSFYSTTEWLREKASPFAKVQARWKAWREAREQKRLKKRVAEIQIAGRPPAPQQTIAPAEPAEKPRKEKLEPTIELTLVKSKDAAPAELMTSSASEPKIARGRTNYRLPSPGLLRLAERAERLEEDDLKECARAIEQKCKEFDVNGHVTQINPGPVVTTYEFKPEAGVKYSRIIGLSDDLCLALKAESILMERIPGKSTVGIEMPNHHRQTIVLREVVESPEFVNSTSKLTMALGKDLVGRIRATELAQMPHLLIAGSTGTGKSVLINSMIVSMLYKATPEELKLVLVDPKRLELGLYEDIPHLFTPVVTDPKVASNVLRNAVREMERRLKLLAQRGVRNIDQYNRTFAKGQSLDLFESIEDQEHRPLPYIVIIIDELADLMMVDTSNVEESVTRLAQMARAVGIHLILATQRPSVDVITGLIKANFPARISFRVASKVDSRTILDANGAESLLGRGDMLFLPAGSSRLHRVHGPLVTEDEVVAVCDFWRTQAKAIYNEELLKAPKEESTSGSEEGGEIENEEVDDELYQEAVRVVCEMGRASTSTLQRRLRVGYGRAARLIDLMEKDGIVGPPDGPRPREVLKKKDWMKEFDESMK